MKNYYIILLLSLLIFNCNNNRKISQNNENLKSVFHEKDTLKIEKNIKYLTSNYDFSEMLEDIINIKETGFKHEDWFSYSQAGLHSILNLKFEEFNQYEKAKSYTYKEKVIFYVHTLKHTNDTISIKPFLENAQGKKTEGYLGIRVLIFAMKNDKEANFIDIPANWKHVELKKELLKILYKNIDSDIILCNRTKKCIYKDLRKNKIKGN